MKQITTVVIAFGFTFCLLCWLVGTAVSYDPSQPQISYAVAESNQLGVLIQEFKPEHSRIKIADSTYTISEVWLEHEWLYTYNSFADKLLGKHPITKSHGRSLLVTLKGHQLPKSYRNSWFIGTNSVHGVGTYGETIFLWLGENDAIPDKLYINKCSSPNNYREAAAIDSIRLHKVK